MSNKNFQYSFTTSKDQTEVFNFLLDPVNWWVGLFGETIKGKSKQLNDEFAFMAGDGMHYSHQRLVESIPGKKIEWLVTESNLSFLKNTNEWAGTKIGFDIEPSAKGTKVTFTHEGLVPNLECYNNCSGAWTQYMHNLSKHLA